MKLSGSAIFPRAINLLNSTIDIRGRLPMNDKPFTLSGSQIQRPAIDQLALLPEGENLRSREIKMPNHKLKRNLLAVGQACFVSYYHLFADKSLSREAVVQMLRDETVYTEQSCMSRTLTARRILEAGRGADALRLVLSSQVSRFSPEIQHAAESLLTEHSRDVAHLLTNRDDSQS